MLTAAQISAENLDALTDEQVLTIQMLVKQYVVYRNQSGLWPRLDLKLADEVATPTVKTQGLKAVLTQLGSLPSIVVESQGNANSQSFFSTKQNWDTLAQDVLDILYDVPVATGATMIAVAQRKIQDMLIYDDSVMSQTKTGRRF